MDGLISPFNLFSWYDLVRNLEDRLRPTQLCERRDYISIFWGMQTLRVGPVSIGIEERRCTSLADHSGSHRRSGGKCWGPVSPPTMNQGEYCQRLSAMGFGDLLVKADRLEACWSTIRRVIRRQKCAVARAERQSRVVLSRKRGEV